MRRTFNSSGSIAGTFWLETNGILKLQRRGRDSENKGDICDRMEIKRNEMMQIMTLLKDC